LKYVLDTNIVIGALNRREAVTRRLDALSAQGESAAVSVLTVAELRYGALTSRRVEDNLARMERLIALLDIVAVDRSVAARFAAVKAHLKPRGLVKSDVDLLIAATALELGATLVSHDGGLNDGTIPELSVEDWLAGFGEP